MPTFSFCCCAKARLSGDSAVAAPAAAAALLKSRRFMRIPPQESAGCYIALQFPGQRMKPERKARGPRPGSIVRVEGLSYGDLDEHLGYVLRRAQLAGFDAFHRA